VKLYDNNNHNIHFTGFLLEEEIVASLWVLMIRNAQYVTKINLLIRL
jgi:hypothetical protein